MRPFKRAVTRSHKPGYLFFVLAICTNWQGARLSRDRRPCQTHRASTRGDGMQIAAFQALGATVAFARK
eukprot:11171692-Lingulodinium_polyedra.AAC.1